MAKKSGYNLKDFELWLTRCGAVVLPTTSIYEIIRVKTNHGVLVAYRNEKNIESWPSVFLIIRNNFIDGQMLSLSPITKSKRNARHLKSRLADRDGLECCYCHAKFSDIDDARITIEHFLSISHGGANHESNLGLACDDCNKAVGNLPIVSKMRYQSNRSRNLN